MWSDSTLCAAGSIGVRGNCYWFPTPAKTRRVKRSDLPTENANVSSPCPDGYDYNATVRLLQPGAVSNDTSKGFNDEKVENGILLYYMLYEAAKMEDYTGFGYGFSDLVGG